MSIVNETNYKNVVTSFLTYEQRILLLRRSAKVGTHQGKWSAVSGHLEGEEDPIHRALIEIEEELGLSREQIKLVRSGQILSAFDPETDTVWIIHPFLFEASSNTVQLDWENTEYKWIEPKELASYLTVPKLQEAFDRVQFDYQTFEALDDVVRDVEKLARDRVHGASFLGRHAIELLLATAKDSHANETESLFADLLRIASRLRKVQPAMANVWNLTGQLLHLVDMKRRAHASVEDLRRLVVELGQKILEQSEDAAEDSARHAAQIIPKEGEVLTHSYSSTVYRAFELGFKSGKVFEVYVTESFPGMEGKQLANDLIALGIPVKLIADSAVNSIIPRLSLVLIGADSVLQDGSLLHKIGTRNIAIAARSHQVSVCVVCESIKFSVSDFLGDRHEISKTIFDITPAEYVSSYITEKGQLEAIDVRKQIVELVMEVYP